MGLVWVRGGSALLFPFTSMKRTPLAVGLRPLESQLVPVNRFLAQVVASQGGPNTSNDRDADEVSVVAHQNVRPFRHTQRSRPVLPSLLFFLMPEYW